MASKFRIFTSNPLALPLNFGKLSQAGYKFNNSFLYQYNLNHGMVDLMAKLKHCWFNGLGYIGGQRIDMDFYRSLNTNDQLIIQSAHHVIYKEDMIITQF